MSTDLDEIWQGSIDARNTLIYVYVIVEIIIYFSNSVNCVFRIDHSALLFGMQLLLLHLNKIKTLGVIMVGYFLLIYYEL